MNIIVRKPDSEDFRRISEIFNQAIRSKFATGFTDEISPALFEKKYRENNSDKYQLLVAESESKILGWIELKPYRPNREVFDITAEVSYFVDFDFHRQGIGDLMLKEIENQAKQVGIEMLIAILMQVNIGSAKLLEKNGYSLYGHLPNVGKQGDTRIDHLYYGKRLIPLE